MFTVSVFLFHFYLCGFSHTSLIESRFATCSLTLKMKALKTNGYLYLRFYGFFWVIFSLCCFISALMPFMHINACLNQCMRKKPFPWLHVIFISSVYKICLLPFYPVSLSDYSFTFSSFYVATTTLFCPIHSPGLCVRMMQEEESFQIQMKALLPRFCTSACAVHV